MKAAVCYEFGKSLVVEDIDIEPPHPGEVKVRIVAAAICHSDIHVIRGEWGSEPPMVPGHEAAGIVEEVGENVTAAKVGDHVVVSLLRSCGSCLYCHTGHSHLCEADYALDKDSRLRNKKGDALGRVLRTAAFAEYCIVHQSQVVPVDKDLPLDRAALLACGVITGLGAVVNTAKVEPGRSAVIIGTGGVGLNAVQGAALAGAHPIIAVDIRDDKLAAARSFGATHAVNIDGMEAPEEAIRELTSGRGADYVFVTVGSTQAITQGFAMLGKRGLEVLVGLPESGATFSVPVWSFINECRITGSLMGSTRLSVDVPHLVDLYQHQRLKLDELISARYPLEQINEAIESTEKGGALRNVIVF